MKERLANAIHWISFTIAVYAVGWILLGELNERWDVIPKAIVPALGAGWALKYVLTGRKGFFPWMTK
jgi:hypothetical protein